MSFQTKKDWFGLTTTDGWQNNIAITDSSDGKTASVATAMDTYGDIRCYDVYGETRSPSCTYKVNSVNTCIDADIVLGKNTQHTIGTGQSAQTVNVRLGSVSINTQAGSEPTITVTGEQVESNQPDQGCLYTVSVGLTHLRHAQDIMDALTSTDVGSNCYITQMNWNISTNIGKTTKDGDCIASDISEGVVTCSISITQCSSTEPTLSLNTSNGFKVTSPLACTNSDSSHPTWTATITKYLTRDEP